MRINKVFFPALAISALFGTLLVLSPANASTSLSIGGVTLSVPENIYEPIGGDAIQVNLPFSNQSGKRILQIKYTITDAIGKDIASGAEIGVPVGGSGFISRNWYGFSFDTARKPLKISLIVSSYDGTGDLITSAPITLLAQPGTQPAPTVTVTAQPQPAPTVTVTAQPQPAPTVTVTAQPVGDIKTLNLLVEVLKAQNSSLNNKVKKICASKPKPKGC